MCCALLAVESLSTPDQVAVKRRAALGQEAWQLAQALVWIPPPSALSPSTAGSVCSGPTHTDERDGAAEESFAMGEEIGDRETVLSSAGTFALLSKPCAGG